VFDAYPKNPEEARTFLKTGVSIDRDFKAARPGLLYTEELVVPGVEWDFKMSIINIKVYPEPDSNDRRSDLIRILIETLKTSGIQVGARKSVGCGLVKLRDPKAKVMAPRNGILEVEWEGSI